VDGSFAIGLQNFVLTFTHVTTNDVITANYNMSTGQYTLVDMAAGDYTVFFSATGYITINHTLTITISGNVDVTNLSFVLIIVPEMANNQWRAILTWDKEPRDLDTYVFYPDLIEVVHFEHKIGAGNKVILDLDDRNGHGPETCTFLMDLTDSTQFYHYMVFNYSNQPDLAVSGAIVRVYNGSKLEATINIATTVTGTYWHVFDLGMNGLILINEVANFDKFKATTNTLFTVSNKLISCSSGSVLTGLSSVSINFMDSLGGNHYGTYNHITGDYSMTDLSAGTYTIIITSSTTIKFQFTFQLTSDIVDHPSFRFCLSDGLLANQYRAVLTWGNTPKDLDTQAYCVGSNGTDNELVTYHRKGAQTPTFKNLVTLDLDDRDGYGPETLTIYANMPSSDDKIYYVVNDFDMTNQLKNSGAQVTLYHSVSQSYTWNVSNTSGDGNYWRVFKVNKDGFVSMDTLNTTPLAMP